MTRRAAMALAIPCSAAALMLAPAPAQAHLVSTGIGPAYDGIAHLFVSFEDLLPVLAIGLLAGLNGAAAGRWLLFSLPLFWLVGGAAGTVLPATPSAFSLAVRAAGSWVAAAGLLMLGWTLAGR